MTDTMTRPAVAALTVADAPRIAAAIAADIASRLGHCVDAAPLGARETRRPGGIVFSLGIEQSFGVMAMAISKVAVEVEAANVDDGTTWVKVDLSWEHPGGGTNGYTVGRWWLKGDEIAQFSAN